MSDCRSPLAHWTRPARPAEVPGRCCWRGPAVAKASARHFSQDDVSCPPSRRADAGALEGILRRHDCFAKIRPTRSAWAPPSVAPRAKDGGADRIQTGDLLVANEALYQLSYCPILGRADLGPCARASKSFFPAGGPREKIANRIRIPSAMGQRPWLSAIGHGGGAAGGSRRSPTVDKRRVGGGRH